MNAPLSVQETAPIEDAAPAQRLLPAVVLGALLVFALATGERLLPRPGSGAYVVEAVPRQWQWTFRYPGGLQTDGVLHLPAGRPVDVRVVGTDVIHSFWVPRLGGKLDAVPGRTLVVRLQADRAGTYRGQCAEFCGTGHAHMTMTVIAMEPADFDAWLRTGQAPVPLLTDNEPKTPVTPHPGSAR